jgi:predicted transcriptional regulator
MNQSGLLKIWQIDEGGASVDGVLLSDTTVDELNIRPWQVTKIRLGVKSDAPNQGGFTLYGRGFGNYQLGIILRIKYDQAELSKPKNAEAMPAKPNLKPVRKRVLANLN